MSKAIVGIATSSNQLESAVNDLQSKAGVPVAEISVLVPDTGGGIDLGPVKATKVPEGATTGAVAGGVAGGVIGLLAGAGTIVVPGLGALIAAGPLMGALGGLGAGAAAGGIVGALIGLGIPEYEAKAYEERLKGGHYLLAVHGGDRERTNKVYEVFRSHGLDHISTVSEKAA